MPSSTVSFVCNICGRNNTVEALTHEAPSCGGCGSNVRLRALAYMLSMELFGEALLLPEFPYLPAVKGLGLSDQSSYATILAGKFDYTNTFYDREPRIDITEPHPDQHGTYDFILSSDVFEHIAVPVERAFEEASKLLKPHGVLCLTTPSSLDEHTVEHFPDLNEYSIASLGGGLVLINRKKDGTLEIRDGLVFHGGVGATLEMRLFSQKDLERTLLGAGFQSVEFLTGGVERFGIVFEGKWSLPLVARKGDFAFDRRAAGQLMRDFQARSSALTELREQYDELTARLVERGAQVDRLDAELAERAVWVEQVQEEHRGALRELERLQAEFGDRTRWALELEGKLAVEAQAAAGFRSKMEALRGKIEAVAGSRWVRLGNRLGMGPRI